MAKEDFPLKMLLGEERTRALFLSHPTPLLHELLIFTFSITNSGRRPAQLEGVTLTTATVDGQQYFRPAWLLLGPRFEDLRESESFRKRGVLFEQVVLKDESPMAYVIFLVPGCQLPTLTSIQVELASGADISTVLSPSLSPTYDTDKRLKAASCPCRYPPVRQRASVQKRKSTGNEVNDTIRVGRVRCFVGVLSVSVSICLP